MTKHKKKYHLPYKLIPFFALAAFALTFGGSFVAQYLGDHFVLQEKFAVAEHFYKIAAVTNPFSQKNKQRFLAAQLGLAERSIPAEESGDIPGQATFGKSQFVLGTTTQVPVLMYHYIRINPDPNDKVGFNLSVTPYNFSAQLDWLKEHGYNTITLDELGANLLYQVPLPDKPVVITLDDGYKDAYTAAFPILKEHNMQAVDFVITGFVNLPRYLSWEEIVEMQKSGIFEIESHTVNHPALTYLAEKDIMQEYLQSKKDLEHHLGVPINWIAYPYGNVNEFVARLTPKAGYIGAFGTQLGTFQSTDAMYTLPRVRIGGGDTAESMGERLPWH